MLPLAHGEHLTVESGISLAISIAFALLPRTTVRNPQVSQKRTQDPLRAALPKIPARAEAMHGRRADPRQRAPTCGVVLPLDPVDSTRVLVDRKTIHA
ncbi:hypothetical protein [Nannocystis punicea]|uniref:Uncharacterized protein n=1 Tax=Nannocystis punicea TaxID=2995304 RepID=A0ABY7H305_9BACT|nr:hypothetical protein [Nannocystis poenicansa]WAS93645.1 hypothetical protein O0S08_46530 [Nannocystis poenicansa]